MIFVGIMPLNVGTRLFERPGEDEVCELQADPGLSAGQVAHVDQDGVEGDAGLVRQLLLVQQPPQQRLCGTSVTYCHDHPDTYAMFDEVYNTLLY